MADINSFVHPQFSFMNNSVKESFPLAECYTLIPKCFPLSNFYNIAFQVYVVQFGDALPFTSEDRYVVYPVKGPPGDCERPTGYFNLVAPVTPSPIIRGLVYSTEDLSAKLIDSEILSDIPDGFAGIINFDSTLIQDIDEWNLTAPDAWKINQGDCFHLQVYEVGYFDGEVSQNLQNPIICTPCFIRTEACYNSAITYRNLENSNDFFYASEDADYANYLNRIELPFYLKNPQLPSEETSYRKSDGVYKKLSERIEEEYTLETDHIIHDWHRNLKIALSSDELAIRNPNIQQQAYRVPNGSDGYSMIIICKEPYEIDWPEDAPEGALMVAKGKTKVKLSDPVAYTNSNCQ